jgi:hypothetical protein
LIALDLTETKDAMVVLWMMLSNTLKLKDLKLNPNILMKLLTELATINPLVTSKSVDIMM